MCTQTLTKHIVLQETLSSRTLSRAIPITYQTQIAIIKSNYETLVSVSECVQSVCVCVCLCEIVCFRIVTHDYLTNSRLCMLIKSVK